VRVDAVVWQAMHRQSDVPEISAVITVLIIDRPLCVDCIALRAQVSVPAVRNYLLKIDTMGSVQRGVDDRCRACGLIGETFWLNRLP
jgi:hypothetical protein